MTSSRRAVLLSVALATSFLFASEPDGARLQPGVLPGPWQTGGPNCVAVPDWQVHEYNEDFYILRESGCTNAEKPFLYLIFGQDKALLEDTGAGRNVETASFVMGLMAEWAKRKNHAPVSLTVIHSHGHGDHTAGDKQFQALPNVQFVAATVPEVQKAAGIVTWPTEVGKIDLGGRMLDVIPIPGHHDASIALYDRLTGNLLTGDSLYPGRLYVADLAAYTVSAQRLADFASAHAVAHVFGTHVEQSNTPYLDYKRGATYQPQEHVLELSRAHVFELNDAFIAMAGKPQTVVLPDFDIAMRTPAVDQAGTGAGLQPGTLPKAWKTGGPNCVAIPSWQVHEYNENFYILRESGCTNYEKPFLYLIFGQEKALLEDTGAGEVQTAPFVMDLLAKWAKKTGHAPVPLVVIHSHAHGDHVAGDKQFQALANVQFIAAASAELQKAAGIAAWPTGTGQIDLGGRVLDIIPIPGHNDASIAIYDRLTGNLLTGDSLYPGRLYVSDMAAFTASTQRLAEFVGGHPIAHVLGTHIEQTKTAYLDYPRGSTYQPEEHSLELTRAHVLELNAALIALKGKMEKVALPDISIAPRTTTPATVATPAMAPAPKAKERELR